MRRVVRRAVLVSLLVAGLSADEAISAPVCHSKRAHTVAREGAVRVLWVSASVNSPYGPARYYVCRGARATYLARTTDTRYIGQVRIRLPFVAYGYGEKDRFSGIAGLARWSAVTRRTHRCIQAESGDPRGTRTHTQPVRVLLTTGGRAAFSLSLQRENDIDPVVHSHEIWRLDGDGCGRLDEGEAVAPASLRFAGSSTVTWTRGEDRRYAELR